MDLAFLVGFHERSGWNSEMRAPLPCAFVLRYIQWMDSNLSLIVAVVSAIFAIAAYIRSNQAGTRALFLEGQKFVLEIDHQLLADPHLWGLYDDRDGVPSDPNFNPDTPLFRGKLRAFAYLHLNMFEVMLSEGSDRISRGDLMFKMWRDYFHDMLKRSSVIRSILDEGPQTLWNAKFIKIYNEWKRAHPRPHAP
jgi:hypothetical protein